MIQFDSHREAIEHVIESTIGEHSGGLFYIIEEMGDRISVEFARRDSVRRAFCATGKVQDCGATKHLEETFNKMSPLPKIMNEVEDLASKAYQNHMKTRRKAQEKGLL